MNPVPTTSTGRVRKFLEICDANYRNRGNVIQTVFEFVGPDPVEHKLTMHDLEALMAEHNALGAAVANATRALRDIPREMLPTGASVALADLERADAKAGAR